MRVWIRDGVRLAYRDEGAPGGRPLVFFGSLGTDMRLWEPVWPLLPDGMRLIRCDMRGHGVSDAPEGPYTLDALVADAAGLLDHLRVQNAVLVGLSLGGMIAQGLAHARPDLARALFLSNTAAKMGDAASWQARIGAITAEGLPALVPSILERWFAPEFLARPEAGLWANMLARTPQAGYLGCCAALAGADLRAQSAALRLPVRVIGGGADRASPPSVVAACAASIEGAAYVQIDRAGHLPCVETSDIWAALLGQFLRDISHRPDSPPGRSG